MPSYDPIPFAVGESAEERRGRYRSYEPNAAVLPRLRALLAESDEVITGVVRETALEFLHRNALPLSFPRHDVMDHVLPLALSLNTSQIHETFADLVKRATLDFLRGLDEPFPYDLLDRTLLARHQFDAYEFYDDIDYVYDEGPRVWRAAREFYAELGQAATKRLWTLACHLHYEMRGLPYRDDDFGGDPPPAEGEPRCG